MHRKIAESSGRFNRPGKSLRRSVRRLRRGRVLVVGTEAKGRKDWFLKTGVDSGWDYAHLKKADGECWATWNTDYWISSGHPRTRILSKATWVRSKAYGGKRTRPVKVLIVPLSPVACPGQKVFGMIVHMPNCKTRMRRLAWRLCARGLTKRINRMRKKQPGSKFIVIGDMNKDNRNKKEHHDLQRYIAKPAGLTNGWDGNMPDHGGTHGAEDLIDHCFTDFEVVDQELLHDDKSSDHQPFGTTLDLPA